MKNAFSLLLSLTLTFISCSTSRSERMKNDLNKMIDKSQRECLTNSPFEERRFLEKRLATQLTFRKEYIDDLKGLLKESQKDTILLVERYSEICINCRAKDIAIYKDLEITTYRDIHNSEIYEKATDVLTPDYLDKNNFRHEDILELKSEIRNNKSKWNKNPEKYGTDLVLGGEYTFYTVLYPDMRVESMYIRCWVPKILRK